jgi:fructose-1,6-bisphosphatase/sedoheptulose 1,7-bisphosphatase-like protein
LALHAGAIETAKEGSPVDIMLGIGGTPEGDLPLLR